MSVTALIIVDVQNDFCEGGSLAVDGGARVAAEITRYLARNHDRYALVIASLDWHLAGSSNDGHIAIPPVEPDFIDSWPAHCIAGTVGAETHPAFETEHVDWFVRKGLGVPAYSAFEGHDDAGRSLSQILTAHGIVAVDVCGLATDYCVAATVRSAREYGLSANLLTDLSAAVHPESVLDLLDELVVRNGAQIVTSAEAG